MAFDGIITAHLIHELQDRLVGGRIRKIYQPEKDEIRLLINHHKENNTLLLSASASNPRVTLTQKQKENPGTAPAFCMVLRKYLLGGTILDFRQHESDRVIEMVIACKNELGDTISRCLITEIMGRNANVILTDRPSGGETPPIITDSLKKVGSASNRYRQILPGRPYIFPPEAGRLNCLTLTREQFDTLLSENPHVPFSKLFVQSLLGVSPGLCREICFRAGVPTEGSAAELGTKMKNYLWQAWSEIRQTIEDGAVPTIFLFHREAQEFTTVPYHHLADLQARSMDSVCQMLEAYYDLRDQAIRFREKSALLRHRLTTLYKKSARKLQNLRQDFQRSEKDEKSKLYGDLITANIWQLQKGMTEVVLADYNAPDAPPVHISLKVNETPAQNAQRYYRRYNKAKRAQEVLRDQIALTAEQTYYLDSLLIALDQCTELSELHEIQHEFNQSEFGKKTDQKNKKDRKYAPSRPLHYRSSEGFDIYVGKNNYQNDFITTRLGTDEDCWLHVKDLPGSHVLIVADGRFIPEVTVLEAGMLAAWHSKARGSENVPVDYVEHRFVKKPAKAKPGMVVFTGQNTMFVTPDREKILGMMQDVVV